MATDPAYDTLTPREREVLDLMARGLTNGQIAEHLDIGFETAKTHVSRIIAKTGAETREEAVANYRSATRPLARVRRGVRGWSWFHPVKVAAGATATAVVIVVGISAWFLWDGTTARQPEVQYLVRVSDQLEVDERLPLSEAVARAEERTTHPVFVPTFMPSGLELEPRSVTVSLPPEHLTNGLAMWWLAYHDEADPEASTVAVQLRWRAFMNRAGVTWTAAEPDPDAHYVELVGGRFTVEIRKARPDTTTYDARSESSEYLTELTVHGDSILREEALAILESVLQQE